ncbi:MAG: glycosyltransferase family 4 protein [Burkholderiaceae bacterium]
MRILIVTTQVPFVRGGAEILADTLLVALRSAGHLAEIAALPFKWYPPSRVLDHMLAARLYDMSSFNGVTIDRIIGLKFPAYLVPHPNKVAWLLHQHRTAYELWDSPYGDLINAPQGHVVRDAIQVADATAFGEMQATYTISGTVTQRLKYYNNIDSEVLYPPPEDSELFYCDAAQEYIFCPSRIEPMKRQHLVIEALALCKEPVKMVFCGVSSVPSYPDTLRARAEELQITSRIRWLGRVSQEEKLRYYAQSMGVVFIPVQEDLGYITMEAMLASKPVITASDSGGPLEFITDHATGLIVEPTAQALAEAMDTLWRERGLAAQWGQAARAAYDAKNISWASVVDALTGPGSAE